MYDDISSARIVATLSNPLFRAAADTREKLRFNVRGNQALFYTQ